MDDDLVRSIVLWFWSGIGLGITIGPLCGLLWRFVGPRSMAFGVGAAVFFLFFTVGAGMATAIAAGAALERRSGTVPALGELRGFESQALHDTRNSLGERKRIVQAPRVAFRTADGRNVEFTALGGSLRGGEPGDVVRVRYRPEKPEIAIVDDFQHQWGAAWGMGAFAGFGLAGAIALLAGLPGDIRKARAADARFAEAVRRTGKKRAAEGPEPRPAPAPKPGPIARWRRLHGARFGRPLVGLGWLNMLLALLAVGAFSDSVARSVAIVFAGVVSGLVCLAFGYWLRGAAADTRFPLGLLGLAAGFAYFGFGAWMLSAP
jgi:hypothetical protein